MEYIANKILSFMIYNNIRFNRKEINEIIDTYQEKYNILKKQIKAIDNFPLKYKMSLNSYSELSFNICQEDIKNINDVFDYMEGLEEEIIVYRSLKKKWSKNDDNLFISTSIIPMLAFGRYVYEIYLPKGTKIIPMITISNFPNENEILVKYKSLIINSDTEIISYNASYYYKTKVYVIE